MIDAIAYPVIISESIGLAALGYALYETCVELANLKCAVEIEVGPGLIALGPDGVAKYIPGQRVEVFPDTGRESMPASDRAVLSGMLAAGECVSPALIASWAGVQRASVPRVAARLAERGFLRGCGMHHEDGRHYQLTEAGKAVAGEGGTP